MTNTILPIGKGIPADVLQRDYALVRDIPYGNASLAYQMLLPKSWGYDAIKAESANLPTDSPKLLALFGGAEQHGATPVIQLHGIRLLREIRAAHWLRLYAEKQNAEIIETNELSHLFADALMTKKIDGHNYILRVAARINANHLFLILGIAISPAYAELAETFGLTIASFKLTNAGDIEAVETKTTYTLTNPLAFQAPTSWHATKPEADKLPPGRQAIDLYNLDAENVPHGFIRIKTISKDVADITSEQVQQGGLEEFSEGGIEISDVIDTYPVPSTNSRFHNNILTIYSATIDKNPQELWVCQLETKQFHTLITLLTPSRNFTFETWAVNKRTYEIILETLK